MKKQITPSAREQLAWINETYQIGLQISRWADEIVASATNSIRPNNEAELDEIAAEIHGITGSTSDWGLSAERYSSSGHLDRFRMVLAAMKNRQAPNQLRLGMSKFSALSDGKFPVVIQMVYEIDRAHDCVAFRSIQYFSESAIEPGDSVGSTAESW